MAKKNFTISTVATAPSPATSGTSLVVAAGTGSLFALNEPAIIFPVNDQPLVANAEIVMVTNVSTDTLTITRTQESTSARTIVAGDIIIQGITAKDWNDLITAVAGKITAFADPNADRIVFWDDSAGAFAALTASTGLTLSGTTLTVRSASETATGIVERATDTEFTNGIDTTRFINAKQVASVAQTMTNKTLTSPVIDTGVSGTAILDEDDMASNSATKLASQQSIKAYVDSGTTTLTNKTIASPLLVDGTNGTIKLSAETDGGDFNLFHQEVGNKTLAIYGSVGNAMNVDLLDGNLTVAGTTTLNGAVVGSGVLDEDDMASNSATKLATQQSIKAYVDSKGFTWKGAWTTSTSYSVNDTVESNGSGYVCTSAHTSGSTTEPGVGASWTTVWDLFVQGVSGNSIQVDSSGGTSDTYGVLSGSVNGSNKVFTVSLGSYVSGSLRVYLNGQLQTQGSAEDWVETTPASGTFTFATAPTTGDIIIVMYQFSTGSTGNADTLDGVHLSGLLDLFYPVGTIYETTSTDLDTTTKMGNHFGGTWEAYGEGKVLVAKSADTEFDTIGETGGVKEVTLTSAQSGVPAHAHPTVGGSGTGGSSYRVHDFASTTNSATGGDSFVPTGNNSAANASQAHTNLQPYIVVYRYRRTA